MSTPQQHPAFAQPHPVVQPPIYQAVPTSGMAVGALIASLLWCFGLGSIIAVTLAMIGWKETKSGMRGGHGLNVAALIIGCLGLIPAAFGILFLLAADLSA